MKNSKQIVIRFLLIFSVILCFGSLNAQEVSETALTSSFPLVSGKTSSVIITDTGENLLIRKMVGFLRDDIDSLTGIKIPCLHGISPATKNILLIGTIDNSSIIKTLVSRHLLDVSKIQNKWEAYLISVIEHPLPGIDKMLVIAGSDRRGAAYGVFELSRKMGISPWYWWADVPVKKKRNIFINLKGALADSPAVKYRGIFINDEAPAFSGWAKAKFDGINHLVYEKVFELMLRLKANYLWPAMWGSAFYDDDSINIKIADEYGIIIGTTHHEPMMRAHDEWRRYGNGQWNYDSNKLQLQEFWRQGMLRATNEKIVSIGMRGDGDMPMSDGTAIQLLESIIKDQRTIIQEATGKPANKTPQLWALYKEVLDYYDKGMRVPEDVTLLLCDDNWGNIRRLPQIEDSLRAGGYGIYYHFDYVGDPRNYKWINTNNLARVCEQMQLAWEYHARKIWIVNVGDIKPMELPISFFLDQAWSPQKWNINHFFQYYSKWAREQFGNSYASQIGNMLGKYAQYASRVKPELLTDSTYSLHNFSEWNRVIKEWDDLMNDMTDVGRKINPVYKNAYFELVEHPITALSNVYHLYYEVACNHFWANVDADSLKNTVVKAKEFYRKDSLLSFYYNHILLDGKWDHMMDQTHIGYAYWQQPLTNTLPALNEEYNTGNKNNADHLFGESMEVSRKKLPTIKEKSSHSEEDGFVSIEAAHFSKTIGDKYFHWETIPGFGKTGAGVCAFPRTKGMNEISKSGPRIEFEFSVTGVMVEPVVYIFCSPGLNFLHSAEGSRYGISIDDELPELVSINGQENDPAHWQQWVANNIIITSSVHRKLRKGKHILKYWLIDPGVILQKLVIVPGEMKHSYLGPPETF